MISTYVLQTGLKEFIKQQFWYDIDELIKVLLKGIFFLIRWGLNGHVGNNSGKRFHGVQGHQVGKELGDAILEFSNNIWFDINEILVQEEWLVVNHLQKWNKCLVK